MGDSSFAITGTAAVCALGLTREAAVEAMRQGAGGISLRPAPEWAGVESMTGAWVRDFKAAPIIPPMKSRRMERSSQMAIVAADAAMRQAGWDVEREGPDALGLFVGSGFCGTHSSLSIVHTLFAQGAEEVSAAAFPNTVPNAPAGLLAIHFGLEGPSATLLQTGTTAEAALLSGSEQLRHKQCRAALWGGVDEVTEYLWHGWRRLGWVGESEGDRRYGLPLHPESRGFFAGEGAAVLVIESGEDAKRRGARPHAAIEHAATGAVDAQPWAYPDEERVDDAAAFFRRALDECAGPPDLVLGCANGHPRLDRFEARVLERVVGGSVPVWYPKAQIGESMASAAVRAALAVWLIEESFVPGNRWLRGVETDFDLTIPTEPVERPVRRVLIPTISAGGTMGATVIAAPM